MGDHRPGLGPPGIPHRRCAGQGWDSGWYAYSEDDAGPLSGLEGSGLGIGPQSGRTVMSGAVFCALAILLLSQAVPAGAADPEKVLLIPVPGTGDLSAGFRPEPQDIKVLSRMTIRKGDSLWRIARRKWGRGDYYPFLLAINTIANPDLIYYGRSLLLPAGTLDRHPELAMRLSGMTAKIVFPQTDAFSQAAPKAAPPAPARAKRGPASAAVP